MREIKKQHVKTILILFTFLFLGYAMVQYSADISIAVYNSIYNCLTVIIPSLYGLLVLSTILVKSNFYAVMSRPFSLISRYIFKIPEEFFSVFLLSLFAGYPVGAKLLNDLVERKKLSAIEAGNMLCYCYASSPTFIIGLVGIKLFSSIKAGLLFYTALVLSNLLIALFLGIFQKTPAKTRSFQNIQMNAETLVSSVDGSARAMFQVCIMIVFFSILNAIFKSTGAIHALSTVFVSWFPVNLQDTSTLILSFLEISNLSQLPVFCMSYIPIIAGIFSFGGVCIILQIVALTKGKIPLGRFLIVRLCATGISAFLAHLLFKIFETDLALSVSSIPILEIRHISPLPTICLIAMTAILLFRVDSASSKAKNIRF